MKRDEKNISTQIFKEYSFYHTQLFLAEELYNSNENVNDEIVNHINDALIELKIDFNRNKTSENENSGKIYKYL